jgi:tellurite resistance protein
MAPHVVPAHTHAARALARSVVSHKRTTRHAPRRRARCCRHDHAACGVVIVDVAVAVVDGPVAASTAAPATRNIIARLQPSPS